MQPLRYSLSLTVFPIFSFLYRNMVDIDIGLRYRERENYTSETQMGFLFRVIRKVRGSETHQLPSSNWFCQKRRERAYYWLTLSQATPMGMK